MDGYSVFELPDSYDADDIRAYLDADDNIIIEAMSNTDTSELQDSPSPKKNISICNPRSNENKENSDIEVDSLTISPNESKCGIKRSACSVDDSSQSSAKKGRNDKMSGIWSHFMINDDDKKTAKCNYCSKSYKHSGNTTNLSTHLKCKHPEKHPSFNNKDEIISKSKSKSKVGALDQIVAKINSYKDGGSHAADLTEEILKMIVVCKMPINTVEKRGFIKLVKYLAPHYTMPSAKTFKKHIRAKYVKLKEQLISKKIEKAISYCVTCDNWSDKKNQSYLGVTLHYLTPELKVHNTNIGVFPMDENHTADNLSTSLESVFTDFRIQKSKILSITTDSASNIKSCITKVLGPGKWIGCFAHLLSHLVPDVLLIRIKKGNEMKYSGINEHNAGLEKGQIEAVNIESINTIIHKVRKISAKIRKSTNASNKLKDMQMAEGATEGTCLRFKMDMEVRWNSTLFMIERYIELHKYVYDVVGELLPANRPDQITPQELDIIRDIVPMMRTVEWGIRNISGESYSTASMVIPMVNIIRSEIESYNPQKKESETFKSKLLDSINRRCNDLENNMPLSLATFLDPRFKKVHFRKPMTVVNVKKLINSMIEKNLDNSSDNVLLPERPKTSAGTSLWSCHNNLVSSNSRRSGQTKNIEVDDYSKLEGLEIQAIPMEVWQTLKNSFPEMYKIAIRYISILGSSVPSERLFSIAGKIKTDDRNRLSGNYLNELVFLSSLPDEDWN